MKNKSLRQKLTEIRASSFIGREYELNLFRNNLMLSSDDLNHKDIVFVSGVGGIGKTTLLQKFIQLSRQEGNICIYLDDIRSIMDFMFQAVIQLEEQGIKNTFKFRNLFKELESNSEEFIERGIMHEKANTNSEKGDDSSVDPLNDIAIQVQGQFNDPYHSLTKEFIDILFSVDEEIKTCLFIDTFEVTKNKIRIWLRNLLEGEYGEIPINTLITIASRNSLKDAGLGMFKSITQEIHLDSFTEEEALELLKRKGVSNSKLLNEYMKISNGIPVLLVLLADSSQDNIEKAVFNEIRDKVKKNELEPAIDSLFRLIESKNLRNEKNELEYLISQIKYLRNEIVHDRIEISYADKENARIINSILTFVERIEKYNF